MLLVLPGDSPGEILPLKIFDDALEVRLELLLIPNFPNKRIRPFCQQMVTNYLLLADVLVVDEERLHRDVAQQEAKAHMELFCFEVDVLLPNRSRFHVFSNTLDCPLKDLLNLIISIGAKSLRVLEKEVEVAFPEINL